MFQGKFLVQNLSALLELIKPQKCPYKLIRIGGNNDGAYLIPDDLKGIKVCFSPGVSNRKDFEDHLAKKFRIKSYLCDFSSDTNKFKTVLIKNMQFFDKKWLDVNNDINSMSLEEWVKKYVSDSSWDLMLQMDIEGAEYRNLLLSPESLLNRFRVLVIEFHDFTNLFNNKKGNEVRALIEKLSKTHTCIHAHPNNCCGEIVDTETGMNIPEVIELTYLRKDRFLNQIKFINPDLPNYQDINSNVIFRRPLHLNINWVNKNKRSVKSKFKIFKDYLLWFSFGPFYKIYTKFPIKNKLLKLFKVI